MSQADRSRNATLLEQLEPRIVLSSFSWSAQEVYLLELVNRARMDPAAEADLLGLDLTAGLTAGELERLVPQEPLALNPLLTIAARAHSLDMAQRGFFDHVNPDGDDPTDRAQAAGYTGVAGENIAAGQDSVDEVHRAWLESLGHRKNVLSLHTSFDNSFHYDEFGPGFAFTSLEPYFDYYGQLFGYDGPNPDRYVLGVVYTDLDNDAFYDVGEGAASVRVDVVRADDPSAVIGSYTTDAAGNYQIVAPDGDYRVVFTDLITGLRTSQTVTIAGENVKADARTGAFTDLIDDHASASAFAQATGVSINAISGDGSAAGVLEAFDDTDLFVFTAAGTGDVTITVERTGGLIDPSVALLGAHGLTLRSGAPSGAGDTASVTFGVAAGQTYYLRIGTGSGLTTGDYTVAVDGPGVASTTHGGDAGLTGDPASVRAAADLADRLTSVFVADAGNPIAFVDAGSSWTSVNLLDAAGGAPATGRAEAFFDASTGRVHVAVPSAAGLLIYTADNAGNWSVRNLTAEVNGGIAIQSQLVVLTNPQGLVTLAGFDVEGSLVAYGQPGGNVIGTEAPRWTFTDINRSQLLPNGLVQPTFAGDLIAYATSWGGLNIAGLDAAGDIHTVWWSPGLSNWTTSNLSEITGAPAYVGGLTAYLTDWDGINLAGVDSRGNLRVTWWVPSFGGDWTVSDLTVVFGGPDLVAGSVTSYVTPWGGLNIAGLDENGDIRVYWWVPDFGGEWLISTIEVDGATTPETGLFSHTSPRGVFNLLGADASGDIVRYAWDPAGENTWTAENLSGLTG